MATVTLPVLTQNVFVRMYRYRWLIYELVSREIRLRYRGSVLGFAWTLLNPLLFMAVYVMVFGTFLRLGFHNFALFLLSGNMAFLWFSGAVNQGTGAILAGRMYVGKTVFPSEVLLLVPVLSGAVNFLLSLPILIVADLIFGQHLGFALLYLPLIMLAEILIAVAMLFFFATINVFYRDFGQLEQYIMLLLFYITPVIYRVGDVPEPYRQIVVSSPIAQMIVAYQDILFFNTIPSVLSLVYLYVFAVALLVVGHTVFSRYHETFGEYL